LANKLRERVSERLRQRGALFSAASHSVRRQIWRCTLFACLCVALGCACPKKSDTATVPSVSTRRVERRLPLAENLQGVPRQVWYHGSAAVSQPDVGCLHERVDTNNLKNALMLFRTHSVALLRDWCFGWSSHTLPPLLRPHWLAFYRASVQSETINPTNRRFTQVEKPVFEELFQGG
jgi:hypothetical protein